MVFSTLLVLFIAMPIIELMVLLRVGESLGVGGAIGLVVLTGVIGAWMARMQGFMLVMKIRAEMNRGELPAPHLMDGLMILIAGVLLITPGLITDTVGFLLLVPAFRNVVKRKLREVMEKKINRGVINIDVSGE